MVHILDLKFLGLEKAIACFLVNTSEGPVIIETGPYSTISSIKNELSRHGLEMSDIKNVFLTHIHLDHAGASWAFAQNQSNIYVHPFGAGHLIDPSKLIESAKRIYKDDLDRLWSDMNPIDSSLITEVKDRDIFKLGNLEVLALHTPGHAKHHIAWKINDIIFTGDVAGVKIGDGPVVPPCPPPDINLEDWNDSISKILSLKPKKLYLTHFGLIENIGEHLNELKEILNDWAYWIKDKWEAGEEKEEIVRQFKEYTAGQLRSKGVNDYGLKQYEAANPSWMSVAGLIRYWKKKAG